MVELTTLVHALVDKLSNWLRLFVVMLPNLIVALLVLVAGVVAARLASNIVCRILIRTTKNQSVSSLLASVVRIALLLVALFFHSVC